MMKTICNLALIAMLASPAALADKPEWAGQGKGEKPSKHDVRGKQQTVRHGNEPPASGTSIEIRFGDNERRIVSDYYGPKFRSGNCPPGLAKKNNGCLPPGQAKKWRRGAPLPADIRYYDLPRDLVIRLPIPPSGQRYVRIAGDILLIAIGTNMVLDAIEDIGR